MESIDALSENWSSLKSELAAVSGLTLTAYPESTKETEAAELSKIYRPEYFVCGRSHQFPYSLGISWAQTIDGVTELVPGQLLSASFPKDRKSVV